MKSGRYYLSTGFKLFRGHWWHFLVDLDWRWRFAFVRPDAKPDYRRIYIGPFQLEWSWARTDFRMPERASFIRRLIVRAAPTCTLWDVHWNVECLYFRPYPKWRISYRELRELSRR